MKLMVEFYKDFDPSVLNGMGYVYTFRTLYMQGSKEHLLEAIRIIDSVTSERSIMLKGDENEQKEMEKEEKDLASAQGAHNGLEQASSAVPTDSLVNKVCKASANGDGA